MSTPPAGGAPLGPGEPVVPAAPPTPHYCYRHPERETGVSCNRCGRYICPECMRPASVGFQCPEEDGAARPARAPRTAVGGRARPGRPGLVTQILIGLCVVAYILQGVPGLGLQQQFNKFTGDYELSGLAIAYDHQYYRLLTAAFLHASLLHILFNMYALYLLGYQLEAVLGRARYLALFVVCAVGGSTMSYLVNGVGTLSVGASTAIFGFFAAFYIIARKLRVNTSSILVVVGINLVITFLIPGIDKWGHIGGLITGVLLGLVYAYVPPRRAWLQAGLTAVVFAALIVASVLRSASISKQPEGVFVGSGAPPAVTAPVSPGAAP